MKNLFQTNSKKSRNSTAERIKSRNNINSNNINNIANNTSSYVYINPLKKKYKLSSKPKEKDFQNKTESPSKFRTCLLSAGTSNTNTIIPLINKMSNYQMFIMHNKSRNKNKEKKKYNTFMEIEDLSKREDMMNKLHKIKIEKGMKSSIVTSLYSKIKQFKNSYLPMVFNNKCQKNMMKKKIEKNKFRTKSCSKDNIS